jgi:beta-glucosidase
MTIPESITPVRTEHLTGHEAYKDPSRSITERVDDLLQRMTLEEKVAQMLCVWHQKKDLVLNNNGRPDAQVVKEHLPFGVGQIARLSDTNGGLKPRESAEFANAIQRIFIENTRLGIPVIFHEECLHGLAGRDATSYPQPIGLAATFDTALVEEIYSTIAADVRARGAHQALTPVVDVAREPRWGRVEETFGEDPYLVSRMGIAAVNGFQGDATFTDGKHLLATLKHFAAHGQPESGTNCAPANVSERLLRDTFLYPFREVLRHANALSVMASYNEIDGVPSHANTWLLGDVLREEWGFTGTVVSDYYAITELHQRDEATSHGVAIDKQEAALLAVKAGVNIELPDPDCYPAVEHLVRTGALLEADIDRLVGPLLHQKFLIGLFDDPYVDPDTIDADRTLAADRPRARRAAQETITLLKNDRSVLPLDVKNYPTIAVIGPNANSALLGGYSGTPRFGSTVLEGLRGRIGKNSTVLYSEGCRITEGGTWNDDAVILPDPAEDEHRLAEAVATAKRSDLVVLVLGDNEQTSREAWSRTHMGDRTSLDLFGRQGDLLKSIVATGKPVVLVLFSGRPYAISYAKDNVAAILACWYLGQEGGLAVADVLLGDVNPSGKLPISFPRSVGHVPCYYNHKPSARRGYLFEDVTPLYPFGYGLSYTTFAFANVRLSKCCIGIGESTAVSVDVTNTGHRVGTEVVQLYIRDVVASVTRPVRELRGFARVTLAAGETKTVTLPITPDRLCFTTISGEWNVEPGEFRILVGSSSREEDLSGVALHVK